MFFIDEYEPTIYAWCGDQWYTMHWTAYDIEMFCAIARII